MKTSVSQFLFVSCTLAGLGACNLADERAGLTSISAQVTDTTATSSSMGLRADAALTSGASRVAVVWRGGGDVSGAFSDPEQPHAGPIKQFFVQELPVTGSFPDSFTIDHSNPPPAEPPGLYVRGSVVLLSDTATSMGQTFELDRYVYGGTGMFAHFTQAGLDKLGIVSMPPVYITYKRNGIDEDNNNVWDGNVGSGEIPLGVGYHLALHDGELYNRGYQHANCRYKAQTPEEEAACGPYPFGEEEHVVTPIAADDMLSIELGGPADLINTPALLVTQQ